VTTTAAAAAIASSTTAATAAAKASTTAAAFTRNHGARLVYRQRTTFIVRTIEFFDRFGAFVIARHFHKTESLAPAGIAIRNHFRGVDLPDLLEN
jgi:hypothetical protein